jgi:hypothetical protein
MSRIQNVLALAILCAVSASVTAQERCEPSGSIEFVCGPANAEDLVLVPETKWIIASAMAPGGEFYLIDSTNGEWAELRSQSRHDAATYPRCPNSPARAELETHGLNIRAGAGGRSTLYAVGHGAREAIEVFDVDATGARPALTWKGCVAMPEGLAANSVASFADGSLVATVVLMPGKTFADSVAMRPTGAVFEWSPGDDGFTLIEGMELPGNNGIEVSADGREIYVVSSGFQTIVAFSNTNPATRLRTTEQLPITPDNVHMSRSGKLLTAGMKNDVPACGGPPGPEHTLQRLATCPRDTIAIEVDPATMDYRVLAETPADPAFSNATMVLPVGDRFWVGTFSGDRIAHGPLPAQPAAALDADYWRGGWRTPLGDEPHIYEFVIRGSDVTGVYCRNCSDATTIGFIDGNWDEQAGIDFTVTFADSDGRVVATDEQHAALVDGRLVVTGASAIRTGEALTLVKDPRGADAPAYHLPPGTPPALPAARRGGAGTGPVAGGGGAGGGGAGRGFGAAPYWPPGPFKALRPEDLVGTWIASFGMGMNKQLFTFLLVGDELRGVVCGRCDNPYTIGALENVLIVGDKLFFDIVHQDWGEIDPPIFDRSIVAQVVQNEMLAGILGNGVVIDPANPPERPAARGFTLVGPLAPEATRGNTSEGIDVWGAGTGSTVEPPPGEIPIVPVSPAP